MGGWWGYNGVSSLWGGWVVGVQWSALTMGPLYVWTLVMGRISGYVE